MSNVKGDVSLYVRLRPGSNDDVCVVPDAHNGVRLRQSQSLRTETSEAVYRCDRTFGPEASQEDVYQQAVTPIVDSVIRGYNGAVIAYGQTGSGKTHTMIGDARRKGVAPRAVGELFRALENRSNCTVEVSVLEIYNERVRDLLAPGPNVTHVEVHEHCANEQNVSFRCPDATSWRASNPEEALAALNEGMRRRETARTDMNHTSSRSHLIFTLTATQSEGIIGATLRGRLHLVDLAGSERLKRSMSSDKAFRTPSLTPRTPRDQRREAGEINKSLSQLALVIQRLTGPQHSSLQYVPYRDCMLTRLLAESFGGSSKTCLIITCSSLSKDREETRCSLEFGKRAKLVRNDAVINLEVTHEITPVMQALVQKEIRQLQLQIQQQKQAMAQERELLLADIQTHKQKLASTQELLKEAAHDVVAQQTCHFEEARRHEDEKIQIQHCNTEILRSAKDAQDELAEQVSELQKCRMELHSRLCDAASEISRLTQDKATTTLQHEEDMERLRAEVAEQVKQVESQKSQTAAFRAESTALRDRWLEDVTRLEAEKSEVIAKAEAEKATLRQRLADATASLARQEERFAARLGPVGAVEEASAAAQQAQAEGVTIMAQSSDKLAVLRKQLEAALSATSESTQLRKTRLTDLEAAHLEMKHKWRLVVEENLNESPPTLQIFESSKCLSQADCTSRMSEVSTDAPLASPCLASRSEIFQVEDMKVSAPSPPKTLSYEHLEPYVPEKSTVPCQTGVVVSLYPGGGISEAQLMAHSGSSAEPFPGWKPSMQSMNLNTSM